MKFGEVGSRRSVRVLRRPLPRLCSTHLPSRIQSNSLKTNDGCHGYPSQNREDNSQDFRTHRGERFHSSFFTAPMRSKLAAEALKNRDRDGSNITQGKR